MMVPNWLQSKYVHEHTLYQITIKQDKVIHYYKFFIIHVMRVRQIHVFHATFTSCNLGHSLNIHDAEDMHPPIRAFLCL